MENYHCEMNEEKPPVIGMWHKGDNSSVIIFQKMIQDHHLSSG